MLRFWKGLKRSCLKLKKVWGKLERSANEEEKDIGEVNMIENEDVVVIADDEGLIERKR